MSTQNIYNKLLMTIGNPFGVCGLMGNLKAESNCMSNNLQNTYSVKFGMTDEQYTKAVDSGVYKNFIKDSAGYGLAQWTYWSRKQSLLEYAQSQKKSIGDEDMQIAFLIKEIKAYSAAWKVLISAKSVKEASDCVLTQYERPARQDDSVKKTRASYGEEFYFQFVTSRKEDVKMSNSPLVNYTKISPNSTNPRKDTIKKITIHHVAGNCSVETIGAIFAPTSRQASSNYGVGTDGRVGMYVEEKNRAWTSSSSANDNQAITIEVANDEVGGNWHVSDKALEKTIELCVDICKRNGIKKLNYTGDISGNLTMHKWFANTNCPGPYLGSKFPYIADEVNNILGADVEAPATKPSGTLYRVQTGAFSVKANADKLASQIKAKGFDTYVTLVGGLYKVQVGAYSVKANADSMLAKLKAAGYKDAFITTNSGSPVGTTPPAPILKVGSKVKVTGSKYATGQTIPSWVKSNTYTVQQIGSDRVLLKEIVSWVFKKDIQII